MSEKLSPALQADIAAVQAISAVPSMLDIICRFTGMGFAAVSRVTQDRWITCSVKDDIGFGLEAGGELKIETTICNETRQPVMIDHVSTDAEYCEYPMPATYGFESYISMPIILGNGCFFGTLCAIDPRPAQASKPEIVGMFRMFAELIALHLDADERLSQSERLLADEQGSARLREQFIAVLGHDLRNPLASIGSGVRLLSSNPPPERATKVLTLMQGSVARMSSLIDNVLDFARGRLGGGLRLAMTPVDLAAVLMQAVDELRLSHPDHDIDVLIALPALVRCDPIRIGQLASNLIGNAVTHGAPASPVEVDATCIAETITLTIRNRGEPIPAAALERLFQPFERGSVRAGLGGLGLGLYICSEIAKAHGGTLVATSDEDSTCFTFTMPLLSG